MQPADFYTGLVADLYAPLKSVRTDPAPYAALVRRYGEPALELGCGDGEPLLDLRRQGLDVEGVDSSADMLARCRTAAREAGLDVVLHHQRMEALDLPGRYRTVFLAGPTFTLLPDDATAAAALRGIRRHLTDDGAAVVPLFLPRPTDPAALGRVREATSPDGALLRFSVRSEERDEQGRTQRSELRYERLADDGHTVLDRTWTLHWHDREGFQALAAEADLATEAVVTPSGRPAPADAEAFTFLLRPAGRTVRPRRPGATAAARHRDAGAAPG